MEKRWSERKELSVGVDVYQQGELLASCFSKDIGLGGAFLGAESSFAVNEESDVELIFKFCDFDTGVFRSLQEIMSYKTSAVN